MVKWIREIEFVESHKAFGEGATTRTMNTSASWPTSESGLG
jgi:hypothetical protein